MSSDYRNTILTPQNSPDHWAIGRLWVGWNSQIYYCDSYDPSMGFWMTNIGDAGDRRNISERAPTRTFHEVRGMWRQADLKAGMAYHMVDLANGPFELREVTYDEALEAPVHVGVFASDWEARTAARTAERAHKERCASD